MRAPKTIDIATLPYVVHDGKRHYEQISDMMLNCFELDCAEPGYTGPYTLGQMVRRIREAESDRAALYEILECIRDADNDCGKDGLPHNLPPQIRKAVDMALSKVGG